jgi:hypothetical protein
MLCLTFDVRICCDGIGLVVSRSYILQDNNYSSGWTHSETHFLYDKHTVIS